jgi:hypothetical protein
MNNIDDDKAREIFQNRITKGMLGPGSDTWGGDDNEEIISDYPLIRYFTGVLFPEKTNPESQLDNDVSEVENETGEYEELELSRIEKENSDHIEEPKVSVNKEDKEDLKVHQNGFFPTNIGLTFCLDDSVTKIDVSFTCGVYFQPTYKEKRIRINDAGYKSFFEEKIPYQLPFKEKLKYDGEFMFLDKELEGHTGGRDKTRSGDYRAFDEFKNSKNLVDTSAKYYIGYLEKLISRAWKRKCINKRLLVDTETTNEPQQIELPKGFHKKLKVSYNVKTYTHRGRKFVKIQLINSSDPHPKNRFSNKNEKLNSTCLFQTKIYIGSESILPYKTHYERFPFDKEAEKLNLIYKNISSFGIGHNCAVIWEGNIPTKIETSFLPHEDIKDVKNDFDDKNDSKLNDALNIKSLSEFGLPKQKVIENLKYFISLYETWIENQKEQTQNLNLADTEISNDIISKQTENLNRLKEGIDLLEDEKIFAAFQMANTAMYIQLITSNDKDFGKDEKEISEISNKVDYNSLDFFRKYNAEQRLAEDKITFIPKYRPFQLAFILLNIDGVVNNQSQSRKEIVDLIWFPTGGGKTEAYLAVTALTIIWRRLNNESGYDGTAVIMRYTLRLLTAQQFERASRLISALEFLRQQPKYEAVLKKEPITIGLWVGMASTPNKLEVAKKRVDEIENECGRINGNPKEKNVFQISACPWCGTKLISKSNSTWEYGFDYTKNDFIVNCINEKCAFHKRIPIQVVDEVLYENPPTLLFGTVDKFAMLAWQEKAFMFFNTHDENKLPPDLIIQDELHLLSGPLGSITGIYESVIELLSTKNQVAPKIIASTATTRNTDMQIEKLYGNRRVNVFPPTGITQDDSFFAKEDNLRSKRRYLGFMPTGKTAVDTQIQLLAHMLVARLEVFLNKETKGSANNYWSLVSYYNSLRDVGRTNNKVGDEITTYTGFLQNRLSAIFPGHVDDYKYNFLGLYARTKELTSRIPSEKIKETLTEIEKKFSEKSFTEGELGRKYLGDVVDLVLATNMISVGIDISRLNIMLLNGMPKNIAEYIQASSRIGRSTKGLAITLFTPNRAREKSYFEHFKSFHQTFYKAVEPLSVTPFTENTIDKMLSSILITFVRQYYPGELNRNNQAQFFTKDKIKPLLSFLRNRLVDQPDDFEVFEKGIARLANEWEERISQTQLRKYDDILRKPGENDGDNKDWILMQSMREVDTTTYVQIKGYK